MNRFQKFNVAVLASLAPFVPVMGMAFAFTCTPSQAVADDIPANPTGIYMGHYRADGDKAETRSTLKINWDSQTKTFGGMWDDFEILNGRLDNGLLRWEHEKDGRYYECDANFVGEALHVRYSSFAMEDGKPRHDRPLRSGGGTDFVRSEFR